MKSGCESVARRAPPIFISFANIFSASVRSKEDRTDNKPVRQSARTLMNSFLSWGGRLMGSVNRAATVKPVVVHVRAWERIINTRVNGVLASC